MPTGLSDEEIPASKAIIGGTESNWEEPWRGAVALGINGYFMCSGTLIDPRVVLTAGHCVKFSPGMSLENAPQMLWIMGGSDVNTNSPDMIKLAQAQKIVAHKNWDGNIESASTDIALVLLDKELTDIPYYRLRDFPMPQTGDPAFLVGYGDDGDGNSAIQRMGDTTLVSVSPELLGTSEGANTCPGDSGGPVFTKQDGDWVLTGVTSFGAGDVCRTDLPMYATNVLVACHWINSVMMEMVGHDLGLEKCALCELDPPCDWGTGCGPGLPECAPGTVCLKPEGFSRGGYGYCAASCCEVGEAEPDHCTDVSDGEELCTFRGEGGSAFCAISCEENGDCPAFTECRNKPFEDQKICIGSDRVFDAGLDPEDLPDTDTCPDLEPNTDLLDAGAQGDAGDHNTDQDDADVGNDGGTSGCGCAVVNGKPRTGLFRLFFEIFGGSR